VEKRGKNGQTQGGNDLRGGPLALREWLSREPQGKEDIRRERDLLASSRGGGKGGSQSNDRLLSAREALRLSTISPWKNGTRRKKRNRRLERRNGETKKESRGRPLEPPPFWDPGLLTFQKKKARSLGTGMKQQKRRKRGSGT